MLFCFIILILTLFKKYNIKINFFTIFLILLFVVPIGWYQIENYFLNQESARYLLIKYGFVTANNNVFGAGFATYGSEMSKRFYSSLYIEYGFNSIWGLSREYGNFINDNYWPMIFGQFSYFGFLLIICCYYFIVKQVLKSTKNTVIYNSIVAILLCFLVGSLGSAYLVSYLGVLNMLSISIFVKKS